MTEGRRAFRKFGLAFAIAAFVAMPPHPRAADPSPPSASRPTIGLVLSGGGARGYAHLGVLRVFEQNRIPVDRIAGTSMGAVVGGLYATGQTADRIIERMQGVNLANVAFDRSDRPNMTQGEREDDEQYPIGLSAGYADGKVKLPAGFVQGNQFLRLLEDWTSGVQGNVSFDQLPIPYRAIATDLETGGEVVLSSGSLPRAIRASMAVPGIYTPIEIDGRLLVDGGLVENLPVDVARQMGAEVIIAVDIGTPLRKRDDINSVLDVSNQMLGILIGQNMRTSKSLLRDQDVLISPALGNITFTQFSRAEEAIAAGEEAAKAAMPRLQQYALSPEQYAAWREERVTRLALDRPQIDKITIVTRGRIPADFIRRHLTVKEGDVYDPVQVKTDIEAMQSIGAYDNFNHELITDEKGVHTLRVEASEPSWGPNIFIFGLSLDTNFNGQGAFRLSVGHRLPWITESGLEWRNDIVLGTDLNRFYTELRQPIPWIANGNYYLAPYAEYQQQDHDFTINDILPGQPTNTLPFAQYQLTTLRAGLDLGIPIGHIGELRAGLTYVDYIDRPKSFIPEILLNPGSLNLTDNALETTRSRLFGPRVRLTLDQLDDPIFPRRGYYLYASSETSLLHDGNNYTEAYADALWAATWGRHSFNFELEVGGDLNIGNQAQPPGFFLGGFQNLSAYPPNQFSGNYLLFGRATYLTPIATFDSAFSRNLFLGASVEAGQVWVQENKNRFGQGPYQTSYSLFSGLTTGVGPVYFGFAFAPAGQFNVYFQLGRPFY